MKKVLSDSNVYIGARYLAFIIAAIASAMFNVFLFTALDPGWTYLLLALSLALEGAKLTTVISINVVKSLYLKLNYKPLLRKSRTLFSWYLVYGLLSVIASLGFSTYITSRTQTIRDSGLEILLSRRAAIEYKMDEIVSIRQSANVATYMEFQPWITANEIWMEEDSLVRAAEARFAQLRLDRDNIMDRESEEWVAANQAFQAQSTYLTQVRATRNRAEAERTRIQATFEASKSDMEGQISILNDELLMLIEQADVEATNGNIALIILTEQIQNEEIKIIHDKGLTYMFEGFSNYTGGRIPPEHIKIFILLLASLLLELTIFQCAPAVRINGLILKYFKRSLPEDRTFNEIIELYADEDIGYVINENPTPKVKETVIDEDEEPLVLGEPDPNPLYRPPENDPPPPPVKKRKPRKKKEYPAPEQPPFPDMKKAVESTIKDFDRLFPADAPEAQPQPMEVIEEKLTQWEKEELPPLPTTMEEMAAYTEEKESVVDQVVDIPEEVTVRPTREIKYQQQIVPPRQVRSNTIRYRFGRATPEIIEKAINFVKLCIDKQGKFVNSPDEASGQLKFSRKAKEVFLEHLSLLSIKDKPLIYKDDGEYFSNFSADEIVNYISEVVED